MSDPTPLEWDKVEPTPIEWDKKTPLVLGKKISQSYKRGGFLGAIIYGRQRLGKSSYASQVLHQIYGNWDDVLDHIVFTLEDVVELLDNAVKNDKKIPALCWDDAGVHANKMLYFQNRMLVQYLQNLIDVVGVNLGGLLITTPSPMNLLRALRGYEFYRVKIFTRDNYNGRAAIGYFSSLLPSGTRIIHRKFKDYYNVMLPDEYWLKYAHKRKSYLSTALGNLREFLTTPSSPLTFKSQPPTDIGLKPLQQEELGNVG